MENYWLAKQEPSAYSFEKLRRDKTTMWDGVHNNLALKHIRNMRPKDLVLFYHTGKEKRAVGIMQVVSEPYPNPEESDERFVVVDVKYRKPLKRPVTLAEIKQNERLAGWDLLRISRLSVMPVPRGMWDEVLRMSESDA